MTALLTTPVPAAPAAPASGRLAARREALTALDAIVRPLLRRRLVDSGLLSSPLPPVIDLTIYDAVYPATPAVGGHWTVAVRRPLFLLHQVDTFTVTLEFDASDRPARYRLSGATEVASEDATVEALDRALDRVLASGPQRTWAPSFVPGFSL